MTCIKCGRNLAKVFAVFVIALMREVIKETKEIDFKLYNAYSTTYGVLPWTQTRYSGSAKQRRRAGTLAMC